MIEQDKAQKNSKRRRAHQRNPAARGLTHRRGSLFKRPGIAACLLATLLLPAGASGTTLIPLSPGQIVERADLVVRATVVSTRTLVSGQSRPPANRPRTEASLAPYEAHRTYDYNPARGDEPESQSVDQPSTILESPSADSIGVEGGRMLFTEVTLQVLSAAKGLPQETLTFVIPGGIDGDTRLVVHGLPTFEVGADYVLFLRSDSRHSAIPLVGGTQGFLRVDSSGASERLLSYEGAILAGINADEFQWLRADASAQTAEFPADEVPANRHLAEQSQTNRYVSAEAANASPPLTPTSLLNAVSQLSGSSVVEVQR